MKEISEEAAEEKEEEEEEEEAKAKEEAKEKEKKKKVKKTAAVREEMLSPVAFDQNFRAMIREFYCYGFRTLEEIDQTVLGKKRDDDAKAGTFHTVNANRDRLMRILNRYVEDDYLQWGPEEESENEKDKKEKEEDSVIYTMMDSVEIPENPFLNVFRFCNCRNFESTVKTVAVLSPEIHQVWEEPFEVERFEEPLDQKDGYNWDKGSRLQQLEGKNGTTISTKVKKDIGLTASQMLMMDSVEFTKKLERADMDWENLNFDKRHDRNTEIDKKRKRKSDELKKLERLGILRSSKPPGKRDRRWALNDLTIREIIRTGEEADPGFKNHFLSALEFYSGYYFLGEIGMFLLDRIQTSETTCQSYESPFRFGRDHFIQVLNDFDLLDLLWAIETGSWCLIEYRHAFADPDAEKNQFLCFPLEIRISTVNGREYLMYYDPLHRMCMSLRLDFICGITSYEDKKVKTVLEKDILKMKVDIKYRISAGEIDAGIEKSRRMLRHVWGVSTCAGERPVENTVNGQKPSPVRLRVKFDKVKEPYVGDRLKREGRNGKPGKEEDKGTKKTMEYRVRAYDPKEVYAWSKSFAGWDITYYKPYYEKGEKPDKEKETDPDKDSEKEQSRENPGTSDYEKWDSIPSEIIDALNENEKERMKEKRKEETNEKKPPKKKRVDEDELIFNALFSTYGRIFATLFTTHMLSGNEWEDDEEWEKAYNAWVRELIKADRDIGTQTSYNWRKIFPADEIKKAFLYEDKETHKLKCKYEWYYEEDSAGKKFPLSFYYDILPLTGIEVRWLKTILNDNCTDDDKHSGKINCFLSDGEIEAVKKALEQRREPELQSDKVIYYDRRKFPTECRHREEKTIRDFLTVLRNRVKADITFRSVPDTDHSPETCSLFVTDTALSEGQNTIEISGTYIPLRILFSKRDNSFTVCLRSCEDGKLCFVKAADITEIKSARKKISEKEKKAAESALTEYYKQETRSVKLHFTGDQNVQDRILMELSPWEKKCTHKITLKQYELELSYLPGEELSLVDGLIGFTYGENVLTFEDQKNEIARMIRRRKKKQADRMKKSQKEKQEDLETFSNHQPGKGR